MSDFSAVPSPSLCTAGVYFPVLSARGGAERLTLVLALELAKAGFRTTIFTAVCAPLDEIERDLGEPISSISIVQLPKPSRLPQLRAVRQATIDRVQANAIRRRNLDLFINCDFRSTLPGCGRVNVFYCHFPHNLVVRGETTAARTYLHALEIGRRVVIDREPRGWIATYQQVWANSGYTAAHVARLWGRAAQVVYPPCDALAPVTKEKLVVAVGRFQAGDGPSVPHKAQAYMIHAFRELTDLHAHGWRFTLLGGATQDDEPFVEALRERAAGFPIELVVNPSRQAIAEHVGAARLFWHAQGVEKDATAHPHTQEHFGISTVEAMSAGVLPLVYGAAGPAEIIAPVMGLSPWNDRDDLLRATRRFSLMSEAAYEELAMRCVRRAEDFDRAHFAASIRAMVRAAGIETKAERACDEPAG